MEAVGWKYDMYNILWMCQDIMECVKISCIIMSSFYVMISTGHETVIQGQDVSVDESVWLALSPHSRWTVTLAILICANLRSLLVTSNVSEKKDTCIHICSLQSSHRWGQLGLTMEHWRVFSLQVRYICSIGQSQDEDLRVMLKDGRSTVS